MIVARQLAAGKETLGERDGARGGFGRVGFDRQAVGGIDRPALDRHAAFLKALQAGLNMGEQRLHAGSDARPGGGVARFVGVKVALSVLLIDEGIRCDHVGRKRRAPVSAHVRKRRRKAVESAAGHNARLNAALAQPVQQRQRFRLDARLQALLIVDERIVEIQRDQSNHLCKILPPQAFLPCSAS